jgi:hypothetical protein
MTVDGTVELQAFFYRTVTTNTAVDGLIDDGKLMEPPVRANTATGFPSALDDFSMDARLAARRMGEVYELLYCLENSMRELIESTLREAFGPEKWWAEGVPDTIRKPADKRRVDDVKARWHSPRGTSMMNYVDFPQYGEIIAERWAHFEDILGDEEWVARYFSEVNRTRRALAHTGGLTETDVERMELRVREWLRVVG